jgi:chemotaxis protein methyltransferase CheR
MDVIFCRNVIIYFDLNGKKRVIETFHQRLQPDGFLLLGHSESLINVTTAFRLRHFKHDMVYQKHGEGPGPGGQA